MPQSPVWQWEQHEAKWNTNVTFIFFHAVLSQAAQVSHWNAIAAGSTSELCWADIKATELLTQQTDGKIGIGISVHCWHCTRSMVCSAAVTSPFMAQLLLSDFTLSAGPFAGAGLSRSTAGTLQRGCSSLSHSTMAAFQTGALDASVPLLWGPALLAVIQLQCPLQEARLLCWAPPLLHGLMNLSISSTHPPKVH